MIMSFQSYENYVIKFSTQQILQLSFYGKERIRHLLCRIK